MRLLTDLRVLESQYSVGFATLKLEKQAWESDLQSQSVAKVSEFCHGKNACVSEGRKKSSANKKRNQKLLAS